MKRTHAGFLSWGGEFRSASLEADYRAECLSEDTRHLRLVFLWAALLNILFYANEFRLHGQPHFPVALAGRTVLVLISLLCLGLTGRIRTVRDSQRICALWSAPVIAASAVLVSPGTDVALLVVFVLPLIFYLCLPMAFSRRLFFGIGCCGLTLGSYMSHAPDPGTFPGLLLGMITLQTVLALVVRQSNRLRRLQWSATRVAQAANRELSEHRLMLRTVLRTVPAPLVILARRTGRVLDANDAARTFFGNELLDDPQALWRVLGRKELLRLALHQPPVGQAVQGETRLRLPDGTWRDVLLATTMARLQGVEAVVAIVVDITRRKEMETRLKRLATTDSLTGLLNRARFFELAAGVMARASRHGLPATVIMLDIDHFKSINDSCGHKAGDRALRAVTDLCRGLARQADLVARLGGEEFVFLLPETDLSGGLALAERVRAEIEALRVPEVPLALSVSVGVSEVLPGEVLVDGALARADRAMYAAKEAGRNRVMAYAAAMEDTPPARVLAS